MPCVVVHAVRSRDTLVMVSTPVAPAKSPAVMDPVRVTTVWPWTMVTVRL